MSLLFKETALEQEFLFALPGSKPLLDVLRRGVKLCSAAWMKKSGDPSEFVPYLRDILKHGGYKSPLSLLGDERRTRIRNAR
jgi:hypothetical protein